MFFQILILFVTNWETEMIQLPSLGTVDGAQHLSSRVLSPSVSIWSVIVLRLALPSPIRFPMACKTAIPRGAFSVTRILAHWEYHF